MVPSTHEILLKSITWILKNIIWLWYRQGRVCFLVFLVSLGILEIFSSQLFFFLTRRTSYYIPQEILQSNVNLIQMIVHLKTSLFFQRMCPEQLLEDNLLFLWTSHSVTSMLYQEPWFPCLSHQGNIVGWLCSILCLSAKYKESRVLPSCPNSTVQLLYYQYKCVFQLQSW